jgi:hypothetical protein
MFRNSITVLICHRDKLLDLTKLFCLSCGGISVYRRIDPVCFHNFELQDKEAAIPTHPLSHPRSPPAILRTKRNT